MRAAAFRVDPFTLKAKRDLHFLSAFGVLSESFGSRKGAGGGEQEIISVRWEQKRKAKGQKSSFEKHQNSTESDPSQVNERTRGEG